MVFKSRRSIKFGFNSYCAQFNFCSQFDTPENFHRHIAADVATKIQQLLFFNESPSIETISEREFPFLAFKNFARQMRREFFAGVRLRNSMGKKHAGASYTASRAANAQGAANVVLDGCEKQ